MMEAGARLGERYLLLEELGRGGMATVFRAWDEHLEVFRAVKVLNSRLARKAKLRARLENEAKLMARLSHPNVVTVHEMRADGKHLYLVMELLLGGTIAERVDRDGPLPPRMAGGLMQGVLSALELAHSHGVVHRDIKPANLMLGTDGTVKLADFGIARLEVSGLTRTGAVMGTLAFMPPEQKLSAKQVDARSDLYAAGATLFAMLTGDEPFDLYAAAMDDELGEEFYSGLPEGLVGFLKRSTAFRPEQRWPSAAEMSAALGEVIADLPVDPEVPPLVSADAISQKKALKSMGPTMLPTSHDLTEHDEDGPAGSETTYLSETPARRPRSVVPALVQPPPTPAPQASSRRGWGVLAVLLFLLFGTGAIGIGAWVAMPDSTVAVRPEPVISPAPVPPRPEPAPPPTAPVALEASEGAPEAATSVAEPPPTVTAKPLPGPAPAPAAAIPAEDPIADDPIADDPIAAVQVAPEVDGPSEPEPPEPVAAGPLGDDAVAEVELPEPAPTSASTERLGNWSVNIEPKGEHPIVIAKLDASNQVTNAKGETGRPTFTVRCEKKDLVLYLSAGMASVEPIPAENGLSMGQAWLWLVTPEHGENRMRATYDTGVHAVLYLPSPRGRLGELLGQDWFEFRYYPINGAESVSARFEAEGFAQVHEVMSDKCKKL